MRSKNPCSRNLEWWGLESEQVWWDVTLLTGYLQALLSLSLVYSLFFFFQIKFIALEGQSISYTSKLQSMESREQAW